MKSRTSIYHQIVRLFLGFTFILSLVYSLLLLGYSWVVEDNIFNKMVKNEVEFIVDYYYKNKRVTQPRNEFLHLYNSWQELPGNIFELHQHEKERVEFELPSGGSIHVKSIRLGDMEYVLAADVSSFEIGREYFPFVSIWLILIILFINGMALLLSVTLSKKTLEPLKRLTNKVSTIQATEIDQTFANEFPDNEVGYLAHTFENSIIQLQNVLKRESNFTRDASHELRTPITILKNLENSLNNDLSLTSKKREHFRYAVSQLQLTVTTLLALAREESVEKEKISLLQVLESCIVNHYELSQNKNFKLNIDIEPSFKVLANRNLLDILINNLLTNAINYADSNKMSIFVEGDDIHFENKIEGFHLAEPFKANTRGENSQGYGLGLNLVKRLCSAFNWQVILKTENKVFSIVISTDVSK